MRDHFDSGKIPTGMLHTSVGHFDPENSRRDMIGTWDFLGWRKFRAHRWYKMMRRSCLSSPMGTVGTLPLQQMSSRQGTLCKKQSQVVNRCRQSMACNPRLELKKCS